MQNRFKFRAWDKFNKIMHYDFQFIKSGEEGNDWICFISDKQPMKCDKTKIIFDSPYFRQQIEIMQSTGLRDKKGKLIYEGDVLGGIYHGYIGYCNECKCFQLKVKDFGCLACEGDIHWYELVEAEEQNELEIIGNIYENTELLKECEDE